ncbi:SLATT domain-containing protein [Klebsiella pneumoniae]|nr:SLATT domain-containing protein [Klebsiella pneumoniae]
MQGKKWNICMFVIYVLCSYVHFIMHIIQFRSIIPISILTTIASSLVGWIQVKRYSELSASYILTAHEIGVIKEQASYVSSESDFSSFIRDAETAFSREHTQWIARRVANRKPK